MKETLACDGCGKSVPGIAAEFFLDEKTSAVAWDHRVSSGGSCTYVSAVHNLQQAPVEASARFANRLNRRRPKRTLAVVDTDDSVAYYVSDVHALLWVAANVVGPAGLGPEVTLSRATPSRSVVRSSEPLGVRHSDEREAEYVYLRLGVGDWLLVSRGSDSAMLRVSGTAFREMLRKGGVDEDQFEEVRRELEIS